MNAFVFEHFRHRADQGIRVLRRQAGEQLNHFEVGNDRTENLLVLDLAGHDGLVYAFGFERLDELAELTERHPVHGCGVLLDLGNVSSLIAATTMSIPWLRAASSTRNGNFPLPAMRPYLFDDATFRRLDEI